MPASCKPGGVATGPGVGSGTETWQRDSGGTAFTWRRPKHRKEAAADLGCLSLCSCGSGATSSAISNAEGWGRSIETKRSGSGNVPRQGAGTAHTAFQLGDMGRQLLTDSSCTLVVKWWRKDAAAVIVKKWGSLQTVVTLMGLLYQRVAGQKRRSSGAAA